MTSKTTPVLKPDNDSLTLSESQGSYDGDSNSLVKLEVRPVIGVGQREVGLGCEETNQALPKTSSSTSPNKKRQTESKSTPVCICAGRGVSSVSLASSRFVTVASIPCGKTYMHRCNQYPWWKYEPIRFLGLGQHPSSD